MKSLKGINRIVNLINGEVLVIRVCVLLLVVLSHFSYGSQSYQSVVNEFKSSCLELVYSSCRSKLTGSQEIQQLLIDTLQLAVLNKQFSSIYATTYGSAELGEFNDAFKFSVSYIDLSDYELISRDENHFILQSSIGNRFVFENKKGQWKLNVDQSLSGVLMQEARQLIELSIGAYTLLIRKINERCTVDEAYKLGGRYFAAVVYDYLDAQNRQRLDEIFKAKNIDVEKVQQELHLEYRQQVQ